MRARKSFRFFKFCVLGLLAVAVFGALTMRLWNALMPPLFGLHALTFWQAVGLLVLCRLLFGRFGKPGGGAGFGPGMQGPWGQRWAQMTPEERERLRAQWAERCGPWGWGGRRDRGTDSPGGETSSQLER